jgi:F0F1-type ATP synthase membrane subunit c/vacuolar-type H+-ATPase subunit K
MSGIFVKFVTLLGAMLVSTMAFAQEGGGGSGSGLMAVGAGLAIGLGALGAATGQGRAAGSYLDGIARNPSAKDDMFQPFILGLVFMELQALLGFVIAILWTLKA